MDDVLRRWPATARVFLRRRMACVGCPASSVHLVREAAASYGLSSRELLAELRAAIRRPALPRLLPRPSRRASTMPVRTGG